MRRLLSTAVVIAGLTCVLPAHGREPVGGAVLTKEAAPGGRVLLDAHNCYPYDGQWVDRIDRALSTGVPLAIEQDLIWYTDPATHQSRSVVSHGGELAGREPSLKDYFFERIRPIVEQALRENRTEHWPLIVLNLDLKSNEPEHHEAIWRTLGEYESWLTTAVKGADPAHVEPLDVKPVLVLTGSADSQEASFSTSRATGTKLRLFGAIRVDPPARLGSEKEAATRLIETTAEEAIPTKATNYRRWANYPWAIVERGGQNQAEEWTAADRARLTALVTRAHLQGLWIRFYTLNGHAAAEGKGWTASYNFGNEPAARARWEAAIDAGVDFVATDQYELFAAALKRKKG